jgi:phosphatidylserine decarboxylase
VARQSLEFDQVLQELVKRSRPSLVSAPAVSPNIAHDFCLFSINLFLHEQTEGIGTVRSHHIGHIFADDGGISSDEDEMGSEEEYEDHLFNSPLPIVSELPTSSNVPPITVEAPSVPVTPTTPTTPVPASKPSLSTRPSGNGFKHRLVFRKSSANTATISETSELPRPLDLPSPPTTPNEAPKRPGLKHGRFSKSWVRKKEDYNFSASNDIVGIVMLEIQSATDLPKFKNSTLIRFF